MSRLLTRFPFRSKNTMQFKFSHFLINMDSGKIFDKRKRFVKFTQAEMQSKKTPNSFGRCLRIRRA